MGKSSKKSTKVDAAPAVVAPTKSATKPGKREAEEAIQNLASAKKQKKDVVAEKKVETKIQNMSKKEETTDEDTSASESEEEQKVKVAPKKGGIPAKPTAEEDSDDDSSSDEDAPVKAGVTSKKQPVATSKNGNVPASKGKLPCSSSDGESSDESESEEDEKPKGKVAAPVKKLPVPSAKNGNVPTKKAEPSDDSESDDSESSDDDEVAAAPKKVENSDSDSDSESEEDEAPAPKVVPSKRPPSAAETKVSKHKKTITKAAESDESSSDESDDEEPQMKKMKAQPSSSDDESSEDSSDDEAPKTQMVKKAAPVSKKVSESDEESEEEDSSGEEDTSEEEEQPSKTSKKNERDVEMVDAVSPKTNVKPAKKAAQSPVTPQVQTGGPKTLFVGNLSFSVEKTDIENFFKGAGEVVDIRFSFDRDGGFRGYGHVEFATAEDALKALELNGRDLLGRNVKLDPAKERGAYTPASGNERSSYQKEGRGQVQTLFIRGFDKSSGLDQVRRALEEHFGTCGEISRLSIQKDYDTDELKGYAYMDFTDSDSFNKALELSGSELEGCALTVQEARPRGDGRDSSSGRGGRDSSSGRGGRGRGGRGRDGDRGRGGRGFTRGRGGRDGGRSGGGSFSGGRGRGGPSRLSMATPGTGNKTKFDD
ncbi:nucleolin 2-like [Rhododendron vialii]|uniref:nucleolin 2-like n=1 Tax=Rhododendron vialii TaxID=182163 RepID=UPI00265F20AD|nr:nucleolin 2-like [Rhododendron vialii]